MVKHSDYMAQRFNSWVPRRNENICPHKTLTTPRMSSNYRLGMIVTCQHKLINCHKCTAMVGVFIMGEIMRVWGQRAYGNSLYLPLKFPVNLQLL